MDREICHARLVEATVTIISEDSVTAVTERAKLLATNAAAAVI